ncbi:MAG: DegV family protein [Chloroflexi bacterium]|nr:DegV family protein [Chloroflexota bacterium]
MTTSKKIRFVTDSTCDIPEELVARYRIGVVPSFVNYGGQSYADDGRELNRETFYQQLPSIRPHPTTSAPSPGLAEQVIGQVAEDADHIVVLTAPAALSAIHNTLRLGVESLGLQDRATLLDSGMVSMGLGYQVLAGALAAEETGDLQRVLEAVKSARERVRVYAGLATMEYLRRSGRVNWAKASVGALLQIKPVIGVLNGEVPQVALVRTFARALDKLAELARAEAPLEQLTILYTHNLESAQAFRERLADIAPPDTRILGVTPVIGVHIGPDSLGVATLRSATR